MAGYRVGIGRLAAALEDEVDELPELSSCRCLVRAGDERTLDDIWHRENLSRRGTIPEAISSTLRGVGKKQLRTEYPQHVL